MPTIDLGQVVGPPGQDGADGQDGAPGAAAKITGASASATTLSAGSSATASVTANGTDASRSFAFTFGIPKGDKGDPGEDGPSNITPATETDITGVLAGDGDNVYGVTVDSAPDSTHTGNLITSAAVADGLAAKADLVPLVHDYVETGTTSAHAYAAGDIVVWNNDLYSAKTDIAVGDTLSSTNLLASSIVGKLHRIRQIIGLSTYGETVPKTYKIPVKRQHAGLLIIQRENSNSVCGVYVFHVGNATGELPYLVPIFESGLSNNFSVSTENHYIDVTMPSASVSLHVTMIECEGFQY